MVKKRTVNARFPLGGENRRGAYAQSEPPYTTFRAKNVRGVDPLERRVRGGSRPGLVKYVTDDFGTQITAIQPLTYVDSSGDIQNDFMVICDGAIKIVSGSTVTTISANLVTEDGDNMITEDGDNLIFAATVSATNPIGNTDAYMTCQTEGKGYIASSTLLELNPLLGTVNTVANAPTSEPIVFEYDGRICLTGKNHMWSMSKQGDFTNWDFVEDYNDESIAVTGNLGEAGIIGSTVTFGAPYDNKYAILATTDDLWLVTGNPSPSGGGGVRNVSREVGIIAPQAACITSDGVLVFLARTGLYTWQIGSEREPEPFSEHVVPEDLRDVDPTSTEVILAYDNKNRGVHVFLTPSSDAGEHWYLEMDTKAMWPVVFGNNNHQPLAVAEFEQSGDSEVVLGCTDGCLRKYSNSATDDDGTDIDSAVMIGPFHIPGEYARTGQIVEMDADFSDNSSGITWKTYVAETAEEVCDNVETDLNAGTETLMHKTATWSENHNAPVYPRSAGAWGVLWLASTGRWSYEAIKLIFSKTGRLR